MRHIHLIAGAAIALLLTAGAADARERTRSGAITGSQGNTINYQSTTTRTNGAKTTNTSYTNQYGKTATRTKATTPQADGTTSVSNTVTRPNGKSFTRDRTTAQ